MSSYNVSRRRSAEGGFVAAGGVLWVFHMQGIGSFLLHLTAFRSPPVLRPPFFRHDGSSHSPSVDPFFLYSLFTELCPHHPTFHFRTPLCESSRVSLASSLSSSSCCFHLIFLCIFLSFLPCIPSSFLSRHHIGFAIGFVVALFFSSLSFCSLSFFSLSKLSPLIHFKFL